MACREQEPGVAWLGGAQRGMAVALAWWRAAGVIRVTLSKPRATARAAVHRNKDLALIHA